MKPICDVSRLLSRSTEDQEDLMRMQRERASNYLKHRTQRLVMDDLYELRSVVREVVGIDVHHFYLEQFTALFPEVRIEISQNGARDTQAMEIMLNCLANLLVGTDFADTPELKQLMCQQAALLWPAKTRSTCTPKKG